MLIVLGTLGPATKSRSRFTAEPSCTRPLLEIMIPLLYAAACKYLLYEQAFVRVSKLFCEARAKLTSRHDEINHRAMNNLLPENGADLHTASAFQSC